MWRRLSGTKHPTDDEIARELRDHLELEAKDLAAAGAGGESSRLARRAFGNPTLIGESVRDLWRWTWFEQLAQDVRLGTRALVRSPAYSAAAIATLALGIGATTTVFSMSDAMLTRPFPLLPQSRLLWIVQRSKSCPTCDNASPAAFLSLATSARSLHGVVAATHWRSALRVGAGSELVEGYRVSPSTFEVIGAPFAMGRGFTADEGTPNGSDVVILSYDFWHDRLRASRGVLDSSVVIAGRPTRVVGVLAEHVVFPTASDVYAPLVLPASALSDHSSRYLDLFARLAPDASLRDAQREAAVISARVDAESARRDAGWSLVPRPLKEFHTDDVTLFLDIAMISAFLVLLAATVSVANLALARAAVRRHELTLRAALGGRRGRLLRHLLVEALLLSLAGGSLGIVLAHWGTRATHDAIPGSMAKFVPGNALIRVDERALLFTLGVSVLVTLLFALLPAMRATSAKLSGIMAEGGRTATGGAHGTRLRAAIVVAEVSVALALLTSAVLMSGSVRNMLAGDPGVRLDNVLTMHLSMARGLSDSVARDFITRADARLHALGGVRGAAFVSTTPLSNNWWGTAFEIPGRRPEADGHALTAADQRITTDYFRTANVRIIAGRALHTRDVVGSPRTVVISRYMKERYWPGVDAVGRVVTIDSMPWTIVGVASDVRHGGFDEPLRSTIYRSAYQAISRDGDLNVWTEGDPASMRDAVRRAIGAVDPNAAVGEMMTMREVEARHVSVFKVMAAGLSIFAGVTMLIAVVGLYGIIAYGVAQRRREIGIRIALGATGRTIVGHIAGGAIRLTLLGVAIGAVGGVGLAQMLRSVLYGVTASDPRTPVALAGLLLAVTLIATLVPAWRAMRLNPAMILRE
jgi:putative ABC transport system permease protein